MPAPSTQPILDALANALLAAGQTWLARWVRGPLGEQARLGTLRFEKGALHIAGARLTTGNGTTIVIERAVLGGVLRALLGRELDIDATLELPDRDVGAIEVRGAVAVGRGGGHGHLTVATKTSCVALEGEVAPSGGIGGATARGTLSFHDAHELGIFASRVRPRRVGGLDFDATLGGTLSAPSIAGRVTSTKILLRLGDDPSLPTLEFDDVSGRLDVDAHRVAWHELSGGILGGHLRTTGVVKLDTKPVEVRAQIELARVRVEKITAHADAAPLLERWVAGALELKGRVDYVGGALSASASFTLDDAKYPAVALAAPSLDAYGLPVPDAAGTSPLTARVAFEDGAIHLSSLRASVDGIDIEGDGSATIGGPIAGEVRFDLLERYLRRSVVLALPALLGARVTVPVVIAGLTVDPAVTFDLARAFESFLERNVIGDAVRAAISDLLGRTR